MAKAPNGTVTRRGSRYRARIKIYTHEWSESFDSRSQALDWLADMRRRHYDDRLRGGLDANVLTLGEALVRYAREITPGQKDTRAVGRIERLVRDEPGLCALPFGRIMPADIGEFIERRRRAGAAAPGASRRR